MNNIMKLLKDNSKMGLIGACAVWVVATIVSTIITLVKYDANIAFNIIVTIIYVAIFGGIGVLVFLGIDNVAKILAIVAYFIWLLLCIVQVIQMFGHLDYYQIHTAIFETIITALILSVLVLFIAWKFLNVSMAKDLIPLVLIAELLLSVVFTIINLIVIKHHDWALLPFDFLTTISTPLIFLFSFMYLFSDGKKQ